MTRARYACYGTRYAVNPCRYLRYAVTRGSLTCVRVRVRPCIRVGSEWQRNRVTQVTARTYRVTRAVTRVTTSILIGEKMEEKKGSLRDAMPGTAAIVDDLRAMLGTALVDGAIATGVRRQREHARMVAIQGQAAADAWLQRQPTPMGCFRAVEGGRQVGILKG